MALTLVIGNKNYSSWSLRGWLAMALTEAPFEELRIPLYAADSHRRLLAHSPTAKVPVLETEADGAIWDSLAIAEYLAERFPRPTSGPSARRPAPMREPSAPRCTAASSPCAATCPWT